MKRPPERVLVCYCPHCGAVEGVVTEKQKREERIGVGTCGECKPTPRGRRWRRWAIYSLDSRHTSRRPKRAGVAA